MGFSKLSVITLCVITRNIRNRFWRAAGLLLLVLGCGGSPARVESPAPAAQPIRLTWLGHAGFEVVSAGGTRLLLDPWLANSAIPKAYADTTRYADPATRPAAILVTHPHGDHAGDAPGLARMSGAKVVATGDHLESMGIPEEQYLSINIGGMQRVGDVEVHAVPAMHSVEPGRALGYVLRFADGRTLYHSGDTWVFGDMALIEQFFHPTIVLLASGGGRAGENPATAAHVARTYFTARVVIPMHYGSLPPPFASRDEVRAAFAADPRARFLTPGEEQTF
jgi:L-ascorbate metabolism protein UlaG (beta-lactamase superfamily)